MVTMPFMFFPHVLEGDTQPWILIVSLLAVCTFRTDQFFFKRDLAILLLSPLCILAFAVRNESGFLLLRYCYMHIAFLALWLVMRREQGQFFPTAIRLTIVIWFLVGFYEFANVSLGHGLGMPELFAGSYSTGRSGVPSLGPEPSYYGSLSVIMMMYLLTEKRASDWPYIVMAAISVILSGSMLSAGLLIFPIMRIRMKYRVLLFILLPLAVLMDSVLTSGGLSARLSGIVGGAGNGLIGILLDVSLNLRAGAIFYTLYETLTSSLLFQHPIAYMEQYNNFAANSGIFVATEGEIILSAIGELIYYSGLIGLALVIVFFRESLDASNTTRDKFEKFVFLLACMLNPIVLSNPFLIAYAQKRARRS